MCSTEILRNDVISVGRNITRYYGTRAAGSLCKYFLIKFFARATHFYFFIIQFNFFFFILFLNFSFMLKLKNSFMLWHLRQDSKTGWPSGLRRWIKAPISSGAWVRIPLQSIFFYNLSHFQGCSVHDYKAMPGQKQAEERKLLISNDFVLEE